MKLILFMIINAHATSTEKKLLRHLFESYDLHVRPVLNDNETVVVKIKHTFKQIIEVDERKELFISNGYSSLRWKDGYLKWDPAKFNGLTSINISPAKVWIPDIVLYDEVDSGKGFGSHVDQRQNRLSISYKGDIAWGLRTRFVTKCHFDIMYFPFDVQTCSFRYGSWSYEKGRIDISPESEVHIEDKAAHSGWILLEHHSLFITKSYSSVDYESIKFSITFKRKAICTVLNLHLPPFIVGILTLLSFVLPAASGERLALTVTLLLSMIFFIVNISHLIPSDDDTIPLIFIFFVTTLIEIVLLIVALIVGMQLYDKKAYDPPMPHWVRHVFYEKLSFWTGTRILSGVKNEVIPLKSEDLENIVDSGFFQAILEDVASSVETARDDKTTLQRFREEAILKEWRIVALTVDRCFFLFFSMTWLITICVFCLIGFFG